MDEVITLRTVRKVIKFSICALLSSSPETRVGAFFFFFYYIPFARCILLCCCLFCKMLWRYEHHSNHLFIQLGHLGESSWSEMRGLVVANDATILNRADVCDTDFCAIVLPNRICLLADVMVAYVRYHRSILCNICTNNYN